MQFFLLALKIHNMPSELGIYTRKMTLAISKDMSE